jgi:hypothetical protein
MSEHDDERGREGAGASSPREPWGPLARRRAREEDGS